MGTERTIGGCVLAAILLAGTACASRGDDEAEPAATNAVAPGPTEAATTVPAPTTAGSASPTRPSTIETATIETATIETATTVAPVTTAPAGETFGTLASPCEPGEATIADGQNGDDGVLRLATANDHDNTIAPGLTQEMLDATKAFASWCNEQGGIQGLQIEIVDMDGHILEAAAAIEVACGEAFAMVGGGLVLDDQEFPRFNECGMIDFAGYTVTATKALSSGMTQPVPGPPNQRSIEWLQWGAEAYPDAVKNAGIIYVDIDTTKNVALQLRASMKVAGWNVKHMLPAGYGEANWAPFAQQLKDNNVTAVSYVGEPTALALIVKAMDDVGYRPELILQEANHYDKAFINNGGASAEGVFVRTAYAPFEEADSHPAIRAYLDMMEKHNPDGKIAQLGLQSTSAALMFATAANDCLDANGGVLERECVLAAGKKITSWTGGGLHAETNPSKNLPPTCGIVMEVVDGAFQRAYPEVGGPDDDGDGFHCPPDGVADIPGTYGDYDLGVDPDRP